MSDHIHQDLIDRATFWIDDNGMVPAMPVGLVAELVAALREPPRCYEEWTPWGPRIVRTAYVTPLAELPPGGYTDDTYRCAAHGNTLSKGPTGEWGHATGYVDEFLICPAASSTPEAGWSTTPRVE